MPYHNRQWNVETINDAAAMAEKIVSHDYCGCVGFRCGRLLWLNDSSCGGNIQEWAVVRESDGRQCETISVGWIDKEDMVKEIIEYQVKYQSGGTPQFGEGYVLPDGALEHPEDCRLCA